MMDLKQEWEIGKRPINKHFQGDFNVKILSGIFRPLGLVYRNWSKTIVDASGYNVRKGKHTGFFIKLFKDNECVLDYNLPCNDVTWNRLNDHVRQLNPDYFIGKIYFKLFGKYRFAGYFSLTRTNPLVLTDVIL